MEEDKQNQDSDVQKEMDDDRHRPLRDMSKRSAVMKDRTMSTDSEASLYTQNNISSVVSLSSPATNAKSRSGPLKLAQQPLPLLHTSWGSSSGSSSSAVGSRFAYPVSSKSSSMAYTPIPKGSPMSNMCRLYLCLSCIWGELMVDFRSNLERYNVGPLWGAIACWWIVLGHVCASVEKVGLPETKYERDLRYVGWYVILFLSCRTKF